MTLIDWIIVVAVIGFILSVAKFSASLVSNSEGWLVAGRGCGRYLGATAGEAAGLGAISLIASMQALYVGGFVGFLQATVAVIVSMAIALTGWGVYRLRETKSMTINEFLDKRYSKKLRIFCGILCFSSGVLNMGIFPLVTSRFVVYFCGFPDTLVVGSIKIRTIAIVMFILIFLAVFIAFKGGQLSLLMTDFCQWAIMMVMFVVIGFFAYKSVKWDAISYVYEHEPNNRTLLDPFMATGANSFGLWYCIMYAARAFYGVLSWAPNTIKGQSATDPKEAKLMWVFSYIRYGSNIGLIFAAIACFAFLKNPTFVDNATQINDRLANINNVNISSQMATPLFLLHILPLGLKGLFLAGMVSASLSTLNTYFLAWSGVFVEDIYMPLKHKKVNSKRHVEILRFGLLLTAFIVFLFGIFYKETDYIVMYFAITASIYISGSGAVILGGLYWSKGTVKGAWSALISGAILAVIGIVMPFLFKEASWWKPWFNGMLFSVISCLGAMIIYIVVSLLTSNGDYDLSNLLNRHQKVKKDPWGKIERVVAVVLILLMLFIVSGFYYSKTHEISTVSWLKFWKYFIFAQYFYSIPVIIWFLIGSICDVRKLIKSQLCSKELLASDHTSDEEYADERS